MDREEHQIIIVGAGPSGLSCAKILSDAGLDYIVIAEKKGGSLLIDYEYLVDSGEYKSSIELAKSLDFPNLRFYQDKVESMSRSGSQWLTNTKDRVFVSNYLVIATGVIPVTNGFRESNRMLIGPSKAAFLFPYEGKSVCILGGGNNAFEHASIAAKRGATKVNIFARTIRAYPKIINLASKASVSISKTVSIEEHNDAIFVDGEKFDVCLVMYGFNGTIPNIQPMVFDFSKDGRIKNPVISEVNVIAIGDVSANTNLSINESIKSGIDAGNKLVNIISPNFLFPR